MVGMEAAAVAAAAAGAGGRVMVRLSCTLRVPRRRTSRYAPAAVLILVAASTGCDSGDETAQLHVPVASAEEDLRIGAVDDPDLGFDYVTALEIGGDGSIYSLHEREAQIRRWSPSGDLMGTIGRRGGGPGEFESPRSLGWRRDSLWVADESRNYRISFFDTAGVYLGALTPSVDLGASVEQHALGIYPARPRGMLGDGTIHGETFPGAPVTPGTPIRIEHVRMSPEGSTIDTVLHQTIGRESVLRFTTESGVTYGSPQPFADGLLVAPANDGMSFLVVQRSASGSDAPAAFHLHRIDLDGDTISSRAHPYPPVAIPHDSIESLVQERVERLRGLTIGGGTAAGRMEDLVREALHTPGTYPPVDELVAGRDGTVWLSLRPDRGAVREWLVLDGDGAPLGKVELPTGVRVMMAERSALWGTVRDEYGVDYIVRYRVELPGMGSATAAGAGQGTTSNP